MIQEFSFLEALDVGMLILNATVLKNSSPSAQFAECSRLTASRTEPVRPPTLHKTGVSSILLPDSASGRFWHVNCIFVRRRKNIAEWMRKWFFMH